MKLLRILCATFPLFIGCDDVATKQPATDNPQAQTNRDSMPVLKTPVDTGSDMPVVIPDTTGQKMPVVEPPANIQPK